MNKDARPNPFHVLGLPAGADRDDIAERGQELAETAATDEDRDLYRWAVGRLIHDAAARARYEVLEAPGAGYRDDLWSAFERRHRRNPANVAALRAAGSLEPADFDLTAIAGEVLDRLLRPAEPDVANGVRAMPRPPRPGGPPLEVADVLFG
ncbi:hypothetical protein [Actinomadura sp. 9N215]|uniref:hypothetical protein n=1 Tax=Actinomadura sp. 9N215 TaxID=3375150 RepID=UPI0037A954FB